MILLYNDRYIEKNIFKRAAEDVDDFMLCVANERIEEVIEFSRSNYNSIPLSSIKDYEKRIKNEKMIFVRVPLDYKINYPYDAIEQKLKPTKDDVLVWDLVKHSYLYSRGYEAQENIVYWWKFIPPLYRKFTEFKVKDIYDKSPDEFPENLKELLTNPVFIKTVRKRNIGRSSSWGGKDYLDALGYSIETLGDETELIATRLIEKPFKEYRCWILNDDDNKMILNVSEYKDYYYDLSIKEIENVSEFVIDYILQNENINKFPKLFVVDIFYFYEENKYDIVEFNPYELAGRYIYNFINSIIHELEQIQI